MPSFNKILVANRGEIACRVLRTAHELGYRSVAVYSEADAEARHVQLADEAVCIGPAAVAQSYLNIEAILDAARRSGAEAIHPGYGFLSENAEFARACEAAGIVFIGPDAEAIHLMGSKRLSKIAMLAAGVPCIPGYEGAEQDDATLRREAERIGYPLMIKASAGGGGRGMRLVEEPDQLLDQLRTARSEALGAFGSAELILEKAVLRPRHVEIQVFGDRHGNLLYLGERDCSVQRRHQKVIEEAPCPVLDADLRRAMGEAAVKAAASVNYVGAGTVEFLLGEDGRFYFLEMNTRLQVEHPVTELVTGQDLVAWQIRVAEGHPLPLRQEQVELRGHAIEVRLYAEDAGRGFLPQTGTVLRWDPELLPGVRIDHGLVEGQAVTPFYDPMLAKLIAYGATRDEARRKLIRALERCVLLGVDGNQRFLANLLAHPDFAAGEATTAFIGERFAEDPSLQPRQPGAEELALAAALLYQAGAEASAHQPGLAGWRSAAGAPWKIVLKHAEQRLEIGLEVLESGRRPRLLARLERREIAVRLLDCDGRWASAELDGIRRRHAYHLDGGRLWLYGHGGNLELLDVTHAGASAQVGASSGTLKAPMDGAIVEVLVGEGERVGKGQLLLVLEAMKMEHPLKAGVDGVVRRVQVGRGEQVRNRQVLVEVEADA
ncbi:geranyl-CoA carboxylase subunit apha [Pseudomonas aeruginosa]|uniref:geranyl-CoA carboxylase subunit apha n=1 Tax=Pseudomonas aeruginosa TaxID=287 RepID=UPI0002120005|nr:geranyl-CoA carboxylase subunit apha [Pseudomonas aeruginosa]EKT8051654.1 geranyl-CoA carboxylase subunit apha [Pseudomonas aeruginosa]ELH4228164.1 geranyl-CoA carboxylase subunit apha [Pseudomonas aeruginosa]ELK4803561.1 geranyl-CoA carboxylase subunit apha [Pseudomonas aeruginosa]ELL4312481.1 geranyl-CoA carboxylase subunit apha [Pseudomonas aeruginosa]ELR9616124.1 geranyl-CoA carboxylase subunit apha [Pseudomonas aeruginosa]